MASSGRRGAAIAPTSRCSTTGRGPESPTTEDADAGGTGLLGLRERLEQAGGSLEAGPWASGGYRVLASVPIGAAS